jgi:glycopeptide antibiotics resistance protein
VDISVDLASKMVTCFFHQQTENGEKYCSIEYGPSRENCKSHNWIKFTTNTSTSGNVVLLIPLNDSEQFQPREEYCFTVTASNGTFTVLIEGITPVLGIITPNMIVYMRA